MWTGTTENRNGENFVILYKVQEMLQIIRENAFNLQMQPSVDNKKMQVGSKQRSDLLELLHK